MSGYSLSATLSGHEDDVRAVTFPTPSLVVSASRDTTVRSWKQLSGQPPTYDDLILSHAHSFVNALTFAQPSSQYPQGLAISGGKDTVIEVRKLETPSEENAERILIGHAHNVCSLDISLDNKFLVSGSWDSTARIWNLDTWACDTVLEEHGGSVWAVLAYDGKTVITGSADQIIRIFDKGGKRISELKGSTDVVRALCRVFSGHVSRADFASAGNDAVVRLWRMSGEQVGELHGHENFIYSLASLPDGGLVSSGEDRTVRIWHAYECVQTITHPAISVWSIAVCSASGDIVSGASDRLVRVFSTSLERRAAPEVIQAFEESVKASSIPKQQIEDINKEKLPGPDFLQRKSGTKEGQVQMIKEENGSIGAYQWSQSDQGWTNVGTVVDSTGSSGRKTSYGGKDYDYVFDVDIEEGKPPLKLPYNLSQNPYEAATKFLQDNELPATYLDQVANFITTNTQGATIGQPQNPSAASQDSSRPKLLPQTTFLSIKTANVTVIAQKIGQFNDQLIREGSDDIVIDKQDLKNIDSAIAPLEACINTSASDSSGLIAATVPVIARMMVTWPPALRIPLLDFARLLAVTTPGLASYESSDKSNAVDLLLSAGSEDSDRENNIMLAIRGLGNLFEGAGKAIVVAKFDSIHAKIKQYAVTKNRNMGIAIATLYINYAVYLLSASSKASSLGSTIISDNVSLIRNATDAEVAYRSLVAIGTLIHAGVNTGGAATNNATLVTALDQVEKRLTEPRIKTISREIRDLLQNK